MCSQSRDFSYFSLFTAGLACFVPLTAAYTQPTGDAPVGNAFSAPGLDSVVPVGQPYTVTWTPSTTGTVTLVLLKGPSSNAVPQYAIVEHIANSGTYTWTPATDLTPSGTTGYGIQLIDDATGQYQYTTQFGISNSNNNSDAGAANSTTSTSVSSSTITTSASLAAATTTTTTATDSTSGTETLVLVSSAITSSAPYPTTSGGVARNGTVNTPTSGITVLTSTKTGTATGTATPTGVVNAAAANIVGSFGAAVVAVAGLVALCA